MVKKPKRKPAKTCHFCLKYERVFCPQQWVRNIKPVEFAQTGSLKSCVDNSYDSEVPEAPIVPALPATTGLTVFGGNSPRSTRYRRIPVSTDGISPKWCCCSTVSATLKVGHHLLHVVKPWLEQPRNTQSRADEWPRRNARFYAATEHAAHDLRHLVDGHRPVRSDVDLQHRILRLQIDGQSQITRHVVGVNERRLDGRVGEKRKAALLQSLPPEVVKPLIEEGNRTPGLPAVSIDSASVTTSHPNIPPCITFLLKPLNTHDIFISPYFERRRFGDDDKWSIHGALHFPRLLSRGILRAG